MALQDVSQHGPDVGGAAIGDGYYTSGCAVCLVDTAEKGCDDVIANDDILDLRATSAQASAVDKRRFSLRFAPCCGDFR